MNANAPQCLVCEQNSDNVPLVQFQFQGSEYWVCSQHLPILIHKPNQLAEKLPGAQNLEGGAHAH